jgi:hypothetical protein
MRDEMMNKYTLLASVGIAVGLLAAPAYSGIDDCRGNFESYDKMKSFEQRQHTFIARNSDKGEGNGGEAIDVTYELPDGPPVPIDCYSTADEDTGGTTFLLLNGDPAGEQDLREFDPGKGNQPPAP